MKHPEAVIPTILHYPSAKRSEVGPHDPRIGIAKRAILFRGKEERVQMPTESAESKVSRIARLELEDGSYVPESSLEDYVEAAHGLEMLVQYVKETDSLPKMILDIGTGKGRALSELAQTPLGHGLSFIGTSLVPRPEFAHMPDNLQIQIAPAEDLKDIPDQSIGAIMSFAGIAFSNDPETVVANMDRVMADGGLIKATFRGKGSYGREWNKKYDAWGYHHHESFSQALGNRGYVVGLLEIKGGDDVILAMKPDRTERDPLYWMDAGLLLSADEMIFRRGRQKQK